MSQSELQGCAQTHPAGGLKVAEIFLDPDITGAHLRLAEAHDRVYSHSHADENVSNGSQKAKLDLFCVIISQLFPIVLVITVIIYSVKRMQSDKRRSGRKGNISCGQKARKRNEWDLQR